MNDDRQREALQKWLAAERAADDVDAEAALVRLMGALPMREPSPGFAERVLASARPVAVPKTLPLHERFRYFAAAALLFAGLGVAAIVRMVSSWMAPAVESVIPAPDGISWLGTAISLVAKFFTDALMLWQRAIGLQRWFYGVLDTPEAALGTVAGFLVCVAAFYALRQVSAGERKIHVGF